MSGIFKTGNIFFIGENGTGKSTFLQAIARACGIHIWKDEERPRYRYNRFEDKLHLFLAIDWADNKVPGAFFASHSPILLTYPDADLYSFDRSPIRKVRYEDTGYLRVYKDFLNNRELYLGEP
ncbi:MAG: hypothetical protein A4E35_01339 [Methanoregula sp. PtaU1.Bin051]|nr:MAG: hypothetical protein A4E35_01339 [Methanoregula sp. PtaU1.Bin051]